MISTLVRKVDFWAALAAFIWAIVAFLWEPRLNELVSYEVALAFALAAFTRAGVIAKGEAKAIPTGGMDDPTPSGPLSDPKSRRGVGTIDVLLASLAGTTTAVGLSYGIAWIAVGGFALGLLWATSPIWLRVFRSTRGSTVIPILILMLTGCAGLAGPGLESVVSRVDVGKAIQCAKQPTPADKARCLGAEVLTVGLGAALEQAALWGTRAIQAASGAGADDLSDRDRREIAREADAALATLGAELAAAETSQ